MVSAINGLDSAIFGAQSRLLEAAAAVGVPRFIPSDFSIDYRGIRPRSNRNLQLRRDFAQTLYATEILATSILNGAFTDMLSAQAPMILFSRLLYSLSFSFYYYVKRISASFTIAARNNALHQSSNPLYNSHRLFFPTAKLCPSSPICAL